MKQDIRIFQGPLDPVRYLPVTLDFKDEQGQSTRVDGSQKLAQDVLLRLFTPRGSLIHDPDFGTSFFTLRGSLFHTTADVENKFAAARQELLNQLQEAGLQDVQLVGVTPAADMLILQVSVVATNGTVSGELAVRMTTA